MHRKIYTNLELLLEREGGRKRGKNMMEESFSCITNIKFLERKRSKACMQSVYKSVKSTTS